MFQSPVGPTEREDVTLLRRVLKETTCHEQEELSKALRLAAERGYEDCTRVLLEFGTLPDIHDRQGFTALMIACRKGHDDIVEVLLAHKCKIDKAGFGIRPTAAHLASSYGHTECLQLLVQAGCKTEVKTVRGVTPLMLASRSGFEDCISLLLRHGADVNAADLCFDTALHYACEEGNTNCSRLLCRAGADINKKDLFGNTPLISAAKNGHIGILKLLTRNVNLKMDVVTKMLSALHWAATSGSCTCVEFLLDHGQEVDMDTKKSYTGHDYIFNQGLTPLMVASMYGHRDLVRLLIQRGADINRCDMEGFTPLTHAVNKSHPDCVLELIRRGAAINTVESSDVTNIVQSPLFIAIKKSIDCLMVLLRAGVNTSVTDAIVTATNEHRITPLELALASSLPGVTCRMLLASGYQVKCILRPVLFQECMARLAEVDEELFHVISESVMVCLSLFVLCRNRVRCLMGRRVISHLDDLPLPSKIKDTIFLKELDSLKNEGGYTTLMI